MECTYYVVQLRHLVAWGLNSGDYGGLGVCLCSPSVTRPISCKLKTRTTSGLSVGVCPFNMGV